VCRTYPCDILIAAITLCALTRAILRLPRPPYCCDFLVARQTLCLPLHFVAALTVATVCLFVCFCHSYSYDGTGNGGFADLFEKGHQHLLAYSRHVDSRAPRTVQCLESDPQYFHDSPARCVRYHKCEWRMAPEWRVLTKVC